MKIKVKNARGDTHPEFIPLSQGESYTGPRPPRQRYPVNNPSTAIQRHHHITLCVGGAQEDYDFHTQLLGMKSVKKTLLYDGQVPIYHLYYGNDRGEESTLVTSFPMRQTGRKARRGSGQIQVLCLSVAPDALSYWETRLREHGYDPKTREAFGERRLAFEHPCGIPYELVGVENDTRIPHTGGPVPTEVGIRGIHTIVVAVREQELSEEFMVDGWGGSRTVTDGSVQRYAVGSGETGALVDFSLQPNLAAGSWAHGEGFIHHSAFQVGDFGEQDAVKGHLEGLGYIDVSDRKDRGYFDSIYVRTPGGPLFEATVSKAKGFAEDEPPESIGRQIMISPQFEEERETLLAQLEKIDY